MSISDALDQARLTRRQRRDAAATTRKSGMTGPKFDVPCGLIELDSSGGFEWNPAGRESMDRMLIFRWFGFSA